MAEYIEREAALIAIKNLYPSIPFTKLLMERWHKENKTYMECETAIEKLPAANVRPVVWGKWEDVDGMFCLCSNCKHASGRTPFCAWCGSDMREEN